MWKRYIIAKDKIGGNWLFLLMVAFLYILTIVFDFSSSIIILKTFGKMFVEILPTLLLISLFIFLFNILVSSKKVTSYLKKGGYFKKIIFSVVFGIASSGPIYLWYGLLRDLHKIGLTLGHIAAFSYARAIKIPMLPIMILYFGIKFSLLFIVVLFFFAFVQGFIVDFIFKRI
ncbi:MAG: hypothetical protein PHR61_01930 [Candidatus Absconditabacteria bacterium]|nr:hypothetical protein [Candidatus Absconditabacteria bacterium]